MHPLLAVIGTSWYAGQAWLADRWSAAYGLNAALGPGKNWESYVVSVMLQN